MEAAEPGADDGGAGGRRSPGRRSQWEVHLHHSALQQLFSPSAAAASPQYSQEFEEEEQKEEFEEEEQKEKEGGVRPVCPEERSPHAGPPSAGGTVEQL